MNIINFIRAFIVFAAPFILAACQLQDFGEMKPDFSQIKKVPASILNISKRAHTPKSENIAEVKNGSALPLKDILGGSLAAKNKGTDFLAVIKYALDTDPEVIGKQRTLEASLASVDVTEAKRGFEVGTIIHGGIEDITDNTKGVALTVKASRLVFDGGKLDSQIASALLEVEFAKMELAATIDHRAHDLFQKWLALEKYKSLQAQIDKRLSILGPLIEQLEKVAEAGVGDVSKVTSARRTVSAIQLEKTKVAEGLYQAQLDFSNAFGVLDDEIEFDYNFITNLIPAAVDDSLVQNAPLLKAQYASYQSSLAKVQGLKAKSGFDVGFEARAMRPFAGSTVDSDESIGFVGRKTLFNSGMLEAEIKEAEAFSEAKLAEIKASYRSGSRSVMAALQNIESMEKAILNARENAELTSDEIVHLRQQLIIGGSTLESVLSAEARLYNAESKETEFIYEKRKSELVVVSALGLLSNSLGY